MPIEETLEPVEGTISKEAKENPAKATPEEKTAMLADAEFIEVTGCDEWTGDEVAHFKEKGFRHFRPGEKPILTATSRPTDYNNDMKRGSVQIHPGLKNYSFCDVEIPDGSTVTGHNFTQAQPGTECITGENLILNDCNLSNVMINPSWTINNCNTSQFWIVEEEIDGEPQESAQFLCSHPSELIAVDTTAPKNAIIARDF